MHHNQNLQMQTQYNHSGMGGMMLGGASHNSSYQKGSIKKKQGAKHSIGHNGMLAALHPSGTIHVGGGSSSVSMGMISTDFKSTMKHNSSNHSIQSKKMVGQIRKPTDLIAHNMNIGAKKGNSNYMSPYSQKMVAKPSHNVHHNSNN